MPSPLPAPSEFEQLADLVPVMLWRANADGVRDWFNRAWLAFVGVTPAQAREHDGFDRLHPDDAPRCRAIYRAALDARIAYVMDYRLRRHDGEYVWLRESGQPRHHGDSFGGYLGNCVDKDAASTAELAQRQLVNEFSHRLNNNLAVIQGIAGMTLRGTRSSEQEREAFLGRLLALAKANELLAAVQWQPIPLRDLVLKLATAIGAQSQLRLDGPVALLPPKTALSFALAIHELLSNARRYGALSAGTGRVDLAWSVGADYRQLQLAWRERGGPRLLAPPKSGLGMRMATRALAAEFAGAVRFDFAADGLSCLLEHVASNRAPLARLDVVLPSPSSTPDGFG